MTAVIDRGQLDISVMLRQCESTLTKSGSGNFIDATDGYVDSA
jgi:hypothetical protein